MKRFLLTASFAFLTAGLFSSCQKEELSALDLAKELTTELQKVTDYQSADSQAPRIEVLNKRFQRALARPLAGNTTALRRSGGEEAGDGEGQEGAALLDALKALAREVARVQASLPVTQHDGDIDRDRLLMAVGAANGAGDDAPASRRKSVGLSHMKGEAPKNEEPGPISDCYGSTKLREALDFTVEPGSISVFEFEDDPEPLPDAVQAADEDTPAEGGDGDTPAGDDDDKGDDGKGDDDTTPTPTPTPAGDDDTTPSTTDDGGLPSLDTDTDDTTPTPSDSTDSTDSSDGDDDDFGIEI